MVKVLYSSRDEYEHITGRLDMLREWRVCCHTYPGCSPRVLQHSPVASAVCNLSHTTPADGGNHAPLATKRVPAPF